MENLLITANTSIISAALEELDATGGTGLTDTEGEAAVLAALSSSGDLVAVLTASNILSQVVTYLWTIIKRLQAKIKALIDMLVDKIRDTTGTSVEWTVAPVEGGQ